MKEQTLYTKDELYKHIRYGDKSIGFEGHPYCYFCSRNFYDENDLLNHKRDSHVVCIICTVEQKKEIFYKNETEYMNHVRIEHYLCNIDGCKYAFGEEYQLELHRVYICILYNREEFIILLIKAFKFQLVLNHTEKQEIK